jgi:sugar phosphate isomerase/epimerase
VDVVALPIAINTYSYSFSHRALDCMLHLRTFGYEAFEILATPPHFWPPHLDANDRREIPQRLADAGIRIISFNHPSLDHNLVSPTPDMRRYTVEKFCALIDLAGEWGVPWIIVVPGKVSPLFPAPRDWLRQWFQEGLSVMAERALRAGTRLLIENVSIAWLPLADDIAEMLDEIGDDRIGVCYDVANAVYIREDPGYGLRRLKDRLCLVHLSDTGTDVWRHDPVGKGIVDFGAVAETLVELGYDGPSVFEIISDDPDRDIRESHRLLARRGWESPVA